MDGKPENINGETIKIALLKLNGMEDVHDLHGWSITSEFPILSCHLVVHKETRIGTIYYARSDPGWRA